MIIDQQLDKTIDNLKDSYSSSDKSSNSIKFTEKLRLGTYNIRNVTDHYHLRLPLINETIEKMNCDMLGLQEFSFLNKRNQLEDLNQKNIYSCFPIQTQLNIALTKKKEKKDPEFNLDGNAVFIKNKHLTKHLSSEEYSAIMALNNQRFLNLSPFRVAQMTNSFIESPNGGLIKINFINTHLHHILHEELIRTNEIRNILLWIDNQISDDDLTVIVGDFNATPGSETYNAILEDGFVSLYKELYGNEPEFTFHTNMDAPFKDTDPEGTFDYIL